MATFIQDFGEGTLTLGGGSELICQVMGCRVSGSNTRQDIVTACGTTTRFINESLTMQIQFLQDWRSGGISKYLWDNYNTDKAFVFSPAADDTPKLTGTLTCARPSMGGPAGQPLTDDLSLPIVGVPTLTADT